jgi:hypothetical protein
MRIVLPIGLFLASIFLVSNSAWSLVWVNTVTETNPPSTDCTPTSLTVTGDLSATHQFVQSGVSVSGFNITVNVEYASGIGIPVITPFTQIVDLGTLPAGTYTVATNGILDGNIQSTFTSTLTVTACCGTNADFTYPPSICLGDQIHLTNSSTGATSQEWFENGVSVSTSLDHSFTPTTSGNIVVKLVTSDGTCQDSIEYTVNVLDPPAVTMLTPNQASYCEGESIEISNNAMNATSYNWTESGNFISAFSTLQTSASTAGSYTYKLIISNGGCLDSMEVSVTVNPLPSIDSFTASDTTLCLGDTVSFTSTSSNATTFKWFENGVNVGNSNDFSTAPSPEGVYTYQLLVELGNCFDSTEHVVEVVALPTVDLGPDTNDCLGPITLDAGSGFSGYLWSDQSTSQTLNPTVTGTYSVTVTDGNGCTASDEVVFESCAGLDENFSAFISAFPNPVQSTLHIDMDSYSGNVYLELVDLEGKAVQKWHVQTSGSIEIDLEDLSPGMYCILLKTDTHSQVFKVLKE